MSDDFMKYDGRRAEPPYETDEDLRQQLTAARAEIARLEGELRSVDEVLARRPALAGIDGRAAQIERACVTAGRESDRANELQHDVARLTGERDALKLAVGIVEAEQDALREKYQELIYQVSEKHHNETRHETAMRYLREREAAQNNTPAQAMREATHG